MSNQIFEEISIDIKELIKFYDQKEENISKPASAITGLIGEDLIAGIFKHFLEECDSTTRNVIIDDISIKAAGKNGKMLDRWIIQEKKDGTKIAYQTEIKNWSAHSLGGYDLSDKNNQNFIDVFLNNKEVKEVGLRNFDNTWGLNPYDEKEGGFKDNSVGKVLLKMNNDIYTKENGYLVKPLVCFWMPIFDKHENAIDPIPPFFSKKCSKVAIDSGNATKKGNVIYNMILGDQQGDHIGNFDEVSFFSTSIYLRSILEKQPNRTHIKIWTNNIKLRIGILQKLIN